MMEAVVLAGGLGTRLRSVVNNLPKPMAPISGRPFLEIVLAMLARKGFGRVVLSLGHLSDAVVNHFGSDFAGMGLVYEIERTPLGTGGALRRALHRCDTDHALVVNGDTFLDLEATEVEAEWRYGKTPIIVAKELPETSRYGRLDVVDGRVVDFIEKGVPGSGLINAGYYLFPTAIVSRFPPDAAFSLESDFLAKEAAKSGFRVFVSRGLFIDIGVPDDYARAQSELIEAYC
jgi:Nucleoside-diphosphate-sugar pyrophosphorylase involved in lipopolysaccharide biosynthesis/translation initiation factor 2B, gamma/epsilon subunits (eIF-2Bgamma/eIF-2Bepsilon)